MLISQTPPSNAGPGTTATEIEVQIATAPTISGLREAAGTRRPARACRPRGLPDTRQRVGRPVEMALAKKVFQNELRRRQQRIEQASVRKAVCMSGSRS